MLDKAAKAHPTSTWWIKADGIDLMKGLCESVGGIWSGDADINDGSLEKQYMAYKQRTIDINELSIGDSAKLEINLGKEKCQLNKDIVFITQGMYS